MQHSSMAQVAHKLCCGEHRFREDAHAGGDLEGPAFAIGTIEVRAGAEVKVEAGAMAAMSGDVRTQRVRRGPARGLKRSVLGGESFFINTFRSPTDGHVAVAAKLPGDMKLLSLSGNTWFVQSGSWIASDPSIKVDTKWGGAKTFFGGEGLFLLKCTGSGEVLVSSYGAILQRAILGARATSSTRGTSWPSPKG